MVFRKATKETSQAVPKLSDTQLASLDGPWTVAFQPDRGAPPSVTLDRLIPWNESSDKSVKYFSGEGTYTPTSFQITARIATEFAGIPISGKASTEARRIGDICPTDAPGTTLK